MLEGIDISLWQNDNIIGRNRPDFCICKASESASCADRTFQSKLDTCKAEGIELVGAYHFACLTNTAETDAVNFLRQVTCREELGNNMMLALDFESHPNYPKNNLLDPNSYVWCRKWLDTVYAETGIKPLLYISGAYTKYCDIIADGDYGLWVAHWDVKKPTKGAWPFWAVWQYTVDKSQNVDRDKFNGSKEQFLMYCRKN